MAKMKRALQSNGFFWVVLAALMVASRLILFDYGQYFTLKSFPNHDMMQGAPFFTTSMHSVRLTGDIAWWNPSSSNGYAQYYQSFLGPFAPTPGHIVFIVWAQAIRVLGWVGIAIPEYFQFLTVTYIVLPFLTFLALGMFLSQLYRRRAPVVAVMIFYTFSSLGIWNGAWFFFQESFSMFFLLAMFIGYLRKPSPQRLTLVLAAGLIQLASLNYWTVYNLWFILLVMGGYGAMHPNQLRRAWVRLRVIIRCHPKSVAMLGGLVALTVAVWGVLLGSIAAEQADRYQREGQSDSDLVKVDDFVKATPINMMRVTNILNPDPYETWKKPYERAASVHEAIYIGLFLVPFLVLLPFFRWGRRERWMLIVLVGTLIISAAPPMFLMLWDGLPFINSIRHYVSFYPGYFHLLLVMLAAGVFDYLLQGRFKPIELRRFHWIIGGLMGLAAFSLVLSSTVNMSFVTIGLYTLIPAVLVYQMMQAPRQRQLFVVLLLIFGFADMSRYFWVVSHVDADFTRQRWDALPRPLPDDIQAKLEVAWPDSSAENDIGVFYTYMPIRSDVWLINSYLQNKYLLELPTPIMVTYLVDRSHFLFFYPTSRVIFEDDPQQIARRIAETPQDFVGWVLLEQSAPTTTPTVAPPNGDYSFEWGDWLYNYFNFDATIPENGWLTIGQLYDPAWEITVDGKEVEPVRANVVTMAIPVTAGEHNIHVEYRPLARKLYWPASLLLEVTLVGLLGVGLGLFQRFGRARRRR